MREFGPEDRGLQAVQTGIDPDFVVMVLHGLAVVGHHANALGQGGIAGEQGAPVSVTTQVLGGEEGSATDIPHGPGMVAAAVAVQVTGTDGLGRILNYVEVVLLGQFQNRLHGRTLPKEMHRHNGPGPRSDGRPHLRRVQGEGLRVHIHQDRGQPEQGDGLSGRHVGEGCGDELIPGLQAQGHHGDLERIRTVGAGDNLRTVQVGTQFRGEGMDLRPVDKGRVLDDLGHVPLHLVTDMQVLGTQVHHGSHKQGV